MIEDVPASNIWITKKGGLQILISKFYFFANQEIKPVTKVLKIGEKKETHFKPNNLRDMKELFFFNQVSFFCFILESYISVVHIRVS